jgi:hypothetical protein
MAFNLPNQILLPKQRPVTPLPTWTRPAGWISITNTTGEVQFLASDIQPTYTIETTFTRPASENIYIDWGDGTTTTVSTNTAVSSSRTLTTGGTSSGLGYNTWKIRIYGDPGTRITGAKILRNSIDLASSIFFPSGLLEAYYGNDTVTTMSNYFRTNDAANAIIFPNLQYVKCPNGLTDANSFLYTFGGTTAGTNGCTALARVDMPSSCTAATTLENTFTGCTNLLSITLPSDMTGLTSMLSTFQNCLALSSVTLPSSLASVTTMASAFQNCTALGSIDLPPMSSCTNFTSTFNTCYNMLWARIQAFTNTAQTITNTSMFTACRSLQNLSLPDSVVNGTLFSGTSAFNGCASLISIKLPDNFNTDSMSNYFSGCSSLTSVVFPSAMPALTSLATTFSSCFQLAEVTLPSTSAATMAMNSTFSTCTALSSITIPPSYNITTLNSTFSNCSALIDLTLPSGAQNSCTTMLNMCDSCYSLETVVMPSALNLVTSIQNAFVNCRKLKSVTFPALPVGASISNAVGSCSALTSVTIPSISTPSNQGIINNAIALTTFTYPTPSSVTTTINESTNIPNLKTFNLPTSNTSSITIFTLSAPTLTLLGNQATFGPTGFNTGARVAWNTSLCYKLPSIDLNLRVAGFTHAGTVTQPLALNSLRLRNLSTDQFNAAAPQIDVRYTQLDTAALDQLFTDLPTIAGKTINITGCPGAPTCNRSIATGKGYTVIG